MPLYGERFVYVPILLSEEQKRVARVRAEAAKREREQARRFAANAKRRTMRKKKEEEEMKEKEEMMEIKEENEENKETMLEKVVTPAEMLSGVEGENPQCTIDERNQDAEEMDVESMGNTEAEECHQACGTDVHASTDIEECHNIFGTPVNTDEKAVCDEETEPSHADGRPKVSVHAPECVDGFGLQLSVPSNQDDGLPLVSVSGCEGTDCCVAVCECEGVGDYEDTSHQDGLPLVTVPGCEDDEEESREIRRSLLIPRRFEAHTGSALLEDLTARFSVQIFQDCVKGKWHIKGLKRNVLPCYSEVRERIALWRKA